MTKKKIQRKKAFTLAEVLITLGIIGVVAALTIPSLMQNIQDAGFKSAWKKQFSAFSQATVSIIGDNGGVGFKNMFTQYHHDELRDLYLSKMKSIKSCNAGGNNTWGQCWVTGGYPNTKFLNGATLPNNATLPLGDDAGAILNDGTFVLFSYEDNNCASGAPPNGGYEGLTNVCGWITVDVNGMKGPNTVGRDIFGMWLLDNKVIPFGTANFSTTCTNTDFGFGCSAIYLNQ